ncbi:hypothetical protein ACJJTC_014747 [Scirpophaga incertulas]
MRLTPFAASATLCTPQGWLGESVVSAKVKPELHAACAVASPRFAYDSTSSETSIFGRDRPNRLKIPRAPSLDAECGPKGGRRCKGELSLSRRTKSRGRQRITIFSAVMDVMSMRDSFIFAL